MDYDLSILIPAYNEENRIGITLNALSSYLQTLDLVCEVLVIDDGSKDNTCQIVNTFIDKFKTLKLISYPNNQGKGHAVKIGMVNCKGEKILFADADGATPFKELEKLLQYSNKGFDIVIGSRALNSKDVILKTPFYRKFLGRIFSFFVKIILGLPYSDTQCGFKLFTKDSAKTLFPLQKLDGFGFDVEILYLAGLKKYSVMEVPVNWSNVQGSKVNLLTDSINMFFDLLRVRFASKID